MVRQRRAEHGEHDYDYDFDEDQSKEQVTCKQNGDTNTKHMTPMHANNDRISQGENTYDISDPFQKTISLKNEGRTSMGPQSMCNLSSLSFGAIDVDWKPITGRLD